MLAFTNYGLSYQVGTYNSAKFKDMHGRVYQTINLTAFVPEESATTSNLRMSSNEIESLELTEYEGKEGYIVSKEVRVDYGLNMIEGLFDSKDVESISAEKVESNLGDELFINDIKQDTIYGDKAFKENYFSETPTFTSNSYANGTNNLKHADLSLTGAKPTERNVVRYSGVTLSPEQLGVYYSYLKGWTYIGTSNSSNTFKFSNDTSSDMPLEVVQKFTPVKTDEDLSDGLDLDLTTNESDDEMFKKYNIDIGSSEHITQKCMKSNGKLKALGIQFSETNSNGKNVGKTEIAAVTALAIVAIVGVALSAASITANVMQWANYEHDMEWMNNTYQKNIQKAKELTETKVDVAYKEGYYDGSEEQLNADKEVIYNYYKNGSISQQTMLDMYSRMESKNEDININVTSPYDMEDVNKWYEEAGIPDSLGLPGGLRGDSNGDGIFDLGDLGNKLMSVITAVAPAAVVVIIIIIVVAIIIGVIRLFKGKDED